MNVLAELKILLNKLDDVLDLGNEGLLKSEDYYETKYVVEDKLKELAPNLDRKNQLRIEKNISRWRNVPKNGIFLNPNQVNLDSLPLYVLLKELQENLSEKHPDVLESIKPEVVIEAGHAYDGRRYLRNIFGLATRDLFLIDQHFRPAILDVLSVYILCKENLRVRILVGDNKELAAFSVNYKAFVRQYPNKVEVKKVKDHPRYILIDGEILFNPDHSFDQWGIKTTNVHQMIDTQEIQKTVKKLEKDWSVGKTLQADVGSFLFP